MGYVVMALTHEPDMHAYRAVIGLERETVEMMVGEDGQPVYAEYDEVEVVTGYDDDGEPVTETLRNPVGEPMTEIVVTVTAVEDILFADEDERWKDKSDKQIAASVKRTVRSLYAKREAEAQAEADRAAQIRHLDVGGEG